MTDSWRLVATAKFTSNRYVVVCVSVYTSIQCLSIQCECIDLCVCVYRVVIQPWNNLAILNISHNKITCLDDYLQVLPALKEVISI